MVTVRATTAMLGLGLAATLAITAAPAAVALPPAGANSSNSAGTNVEIDVSSIAQCDKVTLTVSGYKLADAAYVKIDDGQVTANGSDVLGSISLNGGSGSGQIEIPCDAPTGSHSFRVLGRGTNAEGFEVGYSFKTEEFTITAQGSAAVRKGGTTGTTSGTSNSTTTTTTTTTALGPITWTDPTGRRYNFVELLQYNPQLGAALFTVSAVTLAGLYMFGSKYLKKKEEQAPTTSETSTTTTTTTTTTS